MKGKYKYITPKSKVGIGWSHFYVFGLVLHFQLKEVSIRIGKLDLYYVWGVMDKSMEANADDK